MHTVIICFYMGHQKDGTGVEQYLENFSNHKEVVEHCGGMVGMHP